MRQLPIVAPPRAADEPTGDAARPDLRDEDLHELLLRFYDDVQADALLAPYVAGLDMPAHIPRIADFWSTMVFHTGRYWEVGRSCSLRLADHRPEPIVRSPRATDRRRAIDCRSASRRAR